MDTRHSLQEEQRLQRNHDRPQQRQAGVENDAQGRRRDEGQRQPVRQRHLRQFRCRPDVLLEADQQPLRQAAAHQDEHPPDRTEELRHHAHEFLSGHGRGDTLYFLHLHQHLVERLDHPLTQRLVPMEQPDGQPRQSDADTRPPDQQIVGRVPVSCSVTFPPEQRLPYQNDHRQAGNHRIGKGEARIDRNRSDHHTGEDRDNSAS